MELLLKCHELGIGIKSYKSKKIELINLIKNKSKENTIAISNKYNVISLFSGDIIVHKSSIAKDFKTIIKLKSLNFKVIF